MADLPTFLTTKELADLLRVKERKIYEMASNGEVPCQKVTGKLLFPKDKIEAWIEGKSEVGTVGEITPVVAGSHDPLLEWSLRQAGTGLASFFDGSRDGLARMKARRAIVAGVHIPEGEGRWNLGTFADGFSAMPVVAIHWARRTQGLILPKGSPIKTFKDLRKRRVCLRQEGAGSRMLFDQLASKAGLKEADFIAISEARTETEAAVEVASDRADAALGLEAMARQFGLHFIPLAEESFDLLLWQRTFFETPMQALWSFVKRDGFRERASALGGYDISETGAVRWVGS